MALDSTAVTDAVNDSVNEEALFGRGEPWDDTLGSEQVERDEVYNP